MKEEIRKYPTILTRDEWSEFLQREYVDNHKNIITIAVEYKRSHTTVRKYLKLVGIEIRKKGEWMEGRKLSEQTKRKIADRMKGKKYSEKTKKKVSLALTGRRWTKSQREKFSKSYKSNPANYGRRPWNWKDGKSVTIRRTAEYKDWRLSVFKRDGFACVGCGDNRGGNLQAHHILSFTKYPNLRLDVSNGVTLCRLCHKKIHPHLGFVGLGA